MVVNGICSGRDLCKRGLIVSSDYSRSLSLVQPFPLWRPMFVNALEKKQDIAMKVPICTISIALIGVNEKRGATAQVVCCNLSVCLSVCLLVCLSRSVCLSACPSLSVCLSLSRSVCLPVCPHACPSVCLPARLSIYYLCLSTYLLS